VSRFWGGLRRCSLRSAAFASLNRRSQCEFEPAPVGYLTWFFEPSLQRALLEELMNDLASGEVDNAPVAACG